MKMLFTAAALSFAFVSASASAANFTEKDAIAMNERGVALIKSQGKDALIKAINDKHPDFSQGNGELYIDIRDLKTGILIAHPSKTIVGKDLTDVPDANGKVYRREIMEVAATKGKGWVSYMYRNPVSKALEPKITHIVRVDDVILETGIYKKPD